ncbi:DNA polymerase III, clamp loader complex, gamma/delta/delta subunit [Neurospora hispaniola]|uniref:DNA polymerase III, clamp loader complex, gamma/delta/delta subunit n=1 Tax=Neurospora hispaniola TaxID=588809 RepID=A0AAJ0I6M7_9PEZI|nr:DNA polymerase III, clamp loader complex, gamma/delta/delta subunit [Neurospora hispaniola]
MAVTCPICNQAVKGLDKINSHIDSGCQSFLETAAESATTQAEPQSSGQQSTQNGNLPPSSTQKKRSAADFFQTPAKRLAVSKIPIASTPLPVHGSAAASTAAQTPRTGTKRRFDEGPGLDSPSIDAARNRNGGDGSAETPQQNGNAGEGGVGTGGGEAQPSPPIQPLVKRTKPNNRSAPLAERMRPGSLDDVFGQDLVGPNGVLRALIETDRVPSMILWGGSGTGKTTIARCIAQRTGSRFIELNATSSGVAECKKYFGEAANELHLTGRRTIIFCDEIHRFTKAQQDIFLKPVEAGTITLIGATTENPSFKVPTNRRRTTFLPLRLCRRRRPHGPQPPRTRFIPHHHFPPSDSQPLTKESIKASLTKTLVYDRASDQHYDTISAFHKSIRGSDPDASLYYLARMLQSGEDPLFIARRLVVIASEDVGLADNSLLPLATATYTATQQIGMPEARIPLAHCTVALCLAPKSTRAYRGLNNAFSALREPGVAALPVPLHLRNAPTRLMKEMGYGAEYKYPPNYRNGRVRQEYLPGELVGRKFLEERDLGTEVDPDVEMGEGEDDGEVNGNGEGGVNGTTT